MRWTGMRSELRVVIASVVLVGVPYLLVFTFVKPSFFRGTREAPVYNEYEPPDLVLRRELKPDTVESLIPEIRKLPSTTLLEKFDREELLADANHLAGHSRKAGEGYESLLELAGPRFSSSAIDDGKLATKSYWNYHLAKDEAGMTRILDWSKRYGIRLSANDNVGGSLAGYSYRARFFTLGGRHAGRDMDALDFYYSQALKESGGSDSIRCEYVYRLDRNHRPKMAKLVASKCGRPASPKMQTIYDWVVLPLKSNKSALPTKQELADEKEEALKR
jgi:hypothetical protein